MQGLLYFGQRGLVVQGLGLLVVLWYQGSRGRWRASLEGFLAEVLFSCDP